MGENEATIRSLLEDNAIALDEKQFKALHNKLRCTPPDWWKRAREKEKITQRKIAGNANEVWVLDGDCWEAFVAWVRGWVHTYKKRA